MKTSLKQLAKDLGVSSAYLSQVRHGVRRPSAKSSSNANVMKLLNIKQQVDAKASTIYNTRLARICPSSTMVAQPTCNR
jgi:DNA-binding transcriptional regulator YdaS (Cro superfamily)